ncbi:hypothetical protein PBI_COOPER_55 [Mycobacterium phage Cooper]|uniref:Uncharacterized protein n=1 Tax=Mycobacterium phage Cooper TaxID=373406 RepID=Q1A061_9CAUD|nr:gp55 [Mycobacterium phage Cooper]ABD58172.1 hypothetical protein PBI_COOPER_55 [Mycobacterium phage Cooper]
MTIELETSVTAAQVRTTILVLETGGVDITGNVSQAMLKRLRNAADALEAQAPDLHADPANGLPHPLDIATEYLTDRGACPECSHPVHTTDGPDRGWIHTETGQYTCPPGSAGRMAGPGVTDDMLATKYDEGHADGCAQQEEIDNETMTPDDEVETKVNDAIEQGRKDLFAEMDESISDAVQALADDCTADELREALATAWNRVAP